ncbi:caspase family protein [Colwellia sp. UCD-KL20]|uniref:caspase family protein n=1 Tax=Colwellia sp. UCD-KL20 TaxID=1917165 RepID=UPI0009707E57|nr:caspase family protein [Colwellia sp. UCD-KL20]
MNGRKALFVGIDDYPDSPLNGCINDALEMSSELRRHGNGSANFDVLSITSNNNDITTGLLRENLNNLLKGEPSVAIFYFAGHGTVLEDEAYLCTVDGTKDAPGLPLSEITRKVSNAAGIKNVVVLLDCCFAGQAGNMIIFNKDIATLGKGVTILTACRDNETAAEMDGHGLFTYLMLDALRGGAADILGRITPASIYSHIDQSLGDWDQRPLYKSHVDSFLTLKEMPPKVDLSTLQRLPHFFKTTSDIYQLTPEHEHTTPDGSPNSSGDQVIKGEFRELQNCNRVGLVEPVEEKDMYWAAINSKGCRLTALGVHFHRLAQKGRI